MDKLAFKDQTVDKNKFKQLLKEDHKERDLQMEIIKSLVICNNVRMDLENGQ